jgi:hypothetical protein
VRLRHALPALVAVAAGAVALSAALREEPRVDHAVSFVPEGVVAYAHVAIDRRDDWRRLDRAFGRLPSLEALRGSVLSDIPLAGRRIDFDRDIRPWLGNEAALALTPRPLVVLRAKDPAGARRFAASLAPLRGVLADGFLIVGGSADVQRALDVHRGRAFSLTHNSSFARLRDRLPDKRIADVFIADTARLGMPLPDLGVSSAAASVSIEGDRARIAVRGLGAGAGGRCGSGGGAELVDDAPSDAAALVEVAHVDCAIRSLPPTVLARIRRAGVSPKRDLLPLLRGPGALVVTPTRDAAAATLVAAGVDEGRALDVLGRLQPALIRLTGAERRGQVATFQASDAAGAPALTATVDRVLQPSYAAFDGKIAVSTALDGIAAVHTGGGLGDSDAFRLVLGDVPKRPAAVLFLDLDRLLALGERVGLAQAPAYLAVRDDLQKLGAVGLTLTREGKQTNAEIRFKIP